jgi:hypothetical protein
MTDVLRAVQAAMTEASEEAVAAVDRQQAAKIYPVELRRTPLVRRERAEIFVRELERLGYVIRVTP